MNVITRLAILCFLAVYQPFYQSFADNLLTNASTNHMYGKFIYKLNGDKVELSRLEGNVLVVHFWATWCSGCTDEMKSLNILQKSVRRDKIIVVPISEDFKGSAVVEKFYASYGLGNLLSFIDPGNQLFRELKLNSLPYTLILNASGDIVSSFSGSIDWTKPSTINLLKKHISVKKEDNPDYRELLDIQKMESQSLNTSEQSNSNTDGAKILTNKAIKPLSSNTEKEDLLSKLPQNAETRLPVKPIE